MGVSKLNFSHQHGQQDNPPKWFKGVRKKNAVQIYKAGKQEPKEGYDLDAKLGQWTLRLQRLRASLNFWLLRVPSKYVQPKAFIRISALCLFAYMAYAWSGRETDSDESSIYTATGKSLLAENKLQPEGISHKKAKPKAKPSAKKTAAKGEAPPKSATAPVSFKNLEKADAQTRKYIERYRQIAIDEMNRYGVPASISLAQGLIESRAGTSTLARQNNNHFGMKCFDRNCKKGHCSNHTDDSHKDFFRIYKNPWECWRAHSIMISSGRYAKLKKFGRDYRKWAYGLKSVGYATDRTYADKLIGVIERYKLQQFDR